jgi:hypothetical protein
MPSDVQSKQPGARFVAARSSSAGPTPGSTEHALFVLVVLELLALVAIRRYFRSAHGG